MLADAERRILPALLLVLILYTVSLWTLVRSVRARPGALTLSCAAIITTIGGAGVVAVLKDFEWPPDQSLLISLLFWSFPLFAGIIALTRKRGGRSKED